MHIFEIALISVLLLIVFWIITILFPRLAEAFAPYLGPSYIGISSSYPASFRGPTRYTPGTRYIRRWRSAIPQGPSTFTTPTGQTINILPRQVSDEYWDRSYRSGRGFQIG